MSDFSTAVVRWQKKHGRHTLPWQQDNDAYKIWLSEIMLQQTQVSAVIDYYHNFLQRFPTLATLARSRESSVLTMWSGLGYYARARNLHAAAKRMHKNGVPTSAAGWATLPGVGKSTAAAVAVFAYGERSAILDGNVKRILARTHLLDMPLGTTASERQLWQIAESLLPAKAHIRPYTQGLMDIGAMLCRRTNPLCNTCPLTAHCLAHQRNLTAEYPKRQKKAKKPQKQAHFILLRHGGSVLLQKQPPRGIWGGLWSLPLFGDGATQWQQKLDCRLHSLGEFNFTHEFTHYKLNATVFEYRCDVAAVVAAPLRWQHNFSTIGLPAPVKKILLAAGDK